VRIFGEGKARKGKVVSVFDTLQRLSINPRNAKVQWISFLLSWRVIETCCFSLSGMAFRGTGLFCYCNRWRLLEIVVGVALASSSTLSASVQCSSFDTNGKGFELPS
jgi:hypothetical protein